MIPLPGIAEPVSCLSHSISGLVFSAAVLVLVLPRIPRTARHRWAFNSYVFGVGGMFFASGAYHLVDDANPLRNFLWFLDHGMIWFAIAGTISLYVVTWCPRAPRTLTVLWVIAISGLLLENLFLRDLAPWASPLLYIAMGWVGIFKVLEIVKAEGLRFAWPILAAGATSTLGGIVDAVGRPNPLPRVVEAHEVMHALIAVGMFLFLWGVHRCLVRFGVDPAAETVLEGEADVAAHSVA